MEGSKGKGCLPSGFKREFTCRHMGLLHPEPRLFYTSQWRRYPVVYVSYRILVATYFLVWIVLTGTENHRYTSSQAGRLKWFILLTNWTACVLAANLLIQAITATYCYLTFIRPRRAPPAVMPSYLKFAWASYNLATNSAFLITLLYWGLLYASRPRPLEELMFHTHATNSIYVLLDLFVTAMPIRLLHFYYGTAYAVVYIAFSSIYTVSGGSNYSNHPYIYRFLDWVKAPDRAAIYSMGSLFLGAPGVWFMQYCLYRLRLCLARTCCHHLTGPEVKEGTPCDIKCETVKCETGKCETGKCETGKCETVKCETVKCETVKCETVKCETKSETKCEVKCEVKCEMDTEFYVTHM